ncbi:MAG: hypothetical protein RSE58_14015, partial [Clostridia bacterium]
LEQVASAPAVGLGGFTGNGEKTNHLLFFVLVDFQQKNDYNKVMEYCERWRWEMMNLSKESQAVLSSNGEFTSFSSGGHTIRFRTSPHLVRYTSVKKWDHGYLVVMAKYNNIPHDEEEYIDLIPILHNLYFDAERFLSMIKKVNIHYDN